MQSSSGSALRSAYDRYGPGTERDDVAAGYAAAVGATLATVLYVASVWVVDAERFGVDWSPYFATLEFHWVVFSATRGALVVVPAAFLVGVAGWRILPAETAFEGAVSGAVGAVATYLVAFIPTAAAMSVAGATSAAADAAVTNALEVAGLAVAVGFALTCWLTIPVGCLVGVAYAVSRSPA